MFFLLGKNRGLDILIPCQLLPAGKKRNGCVYPALFITRATCTCTGTLVNTPTNPDGGGGGGIWGGDTVKCIMKR